ncbi:hypothetical protein BGZ65_009823 [Modicella reniformis]|uniref:Uncharacterized protein n=1 Tax=Modicella reniformis TaxID=1440133 RepID=A0A9P6MK18_9FUNG|nr:hypothetical protein BGZ65_009823 [Modicella reniformis]
MEKSAIADPQKNVPKTSVATPKHVNWLPAHNADKKATSFLKKNMMMFAVGGSSIIVALSFCLVSIFFLRRKKRIHQEKEKKQDSHPMSENPDFTQKRRSNIRIGLDPIEIGLVDVSPSYDPKSSLTRRTSSGFQNANVREVRPGGSYAPDSLMTEQEMVLDLESHSNQLLSTSVSTWQTIQISNSSTSTFQEPPATSSTWASSSRNGDALHKSASMTSIRRTVYVPPPLPPVNLASPARTPSPYADEAMIVYPPESPLQTLPSAMSSRTNDKSNSLGVKLARSKRSGEEPTVGGNIARSYVDNNDVNMETLKVDRYTENSKDGSANDRASVSSFFSTLAIDLEPMSTVSTSMLPPPEPTFASEVFIMPAPVARIAPATPTQAGPSSSSTPGSQDQESAFERKQEEIRVAACFAQDLGFEIVDPSPASSPRHVPTVVKSPTHF